MSLPTGTVTFLFTDIEGSTRLWERYPEAMKPVLARHDAILRQAVEAHDGQVVKTSGDGLLAVFEAGVNGIASSIAAQQALLAEPWAEIKPDRVNVRMGLHSGEAELRDGDYYGGALNRAARLMGVAHGGQILISNTTAELVREQLPPDTALQDLGEHRLKDLVRPEHAYQLAHAALPNDFPPLRSLDSFPNNLPVQLTSFIGRESELAKGRHKLAVAHLLSLVGPGGTGKTRLALQLAAEVLPSFADGVWLVELAPLTDAVLILQAVAAVLGVREQNSMPLMAVIADWLRAKQTLLILDNCEHVLEACARLADQILRGSPNVKIIASSRQALGISGEIILQVPSLALPGPDETRRQALARSEAVQLFVERATAANPKFALSDKNSLHVAQICRRLDGIPLAIELAAARVTLFAPEQIASRLNNRFQLLTGGSRTALPRQQTLRALIDWSYELLSPAERALLRRLSVFAGGWTFEAAESLCSDLDVLSGLTQLVNKSLVVADDEGAQTRYRLLETIRQYAHDTLVEAGELDQWRGRHLAYFVELAEAGGARMDSGDALDWLPRLEAEYDNFRAALEWGLDHNIEDCLRLVDALWVFWYRRGHTLEGINWINWINETLARAEALPEPPGEAARQTMRLRARVWQDMAALAYMNNNPTALKASQACIALARQVNDPSLLAMSLSIAGSAKLLLGDPAGARACLDEGLAIARALGDPYLLGFALCMMAQFTASVDRDYETAGAYDDEGLELLNGYASSWGAIHAIYASGRGAMMRADYPAARARFLKSLPRYEQMGDVQRVNVIQSELAHMERYQGHYQQAEAAYRLTIRVWQRLGHRAAIAHQLESFALTARAQAQTERAARLFGAAEALRERIGIPMNPEERIEYDREVAGLRGTLDVNSLSMCWSEGRGLTLEQAVAYATGDDALPAGGG